jgi:D-alanyl-D-alanine carboxypeptidase/D-alanyl-D-alanine-endopeptidase (penicillin-binding protein 4)
MRFLPIARRVTPVAAFLATACAGARATGAPAPRTPDAAFRRSVDSLLADPRFRNAQLGVLVVDPVRGDTLYSHNAGKLFMPASNQKLLTGAVALAQLGPDFRFSTAVLADGELDGGVVLGNLRVVGMGDPSISNHMAGDAMQPLRRLADSLVARGIMRVTGALVPGNDAFPDAAWGFGWSWDDMDFPYSAGVDDLFLNEGFMEVEVRAGAEPGAPVWVRVRPNGAFPQVRILATTVARDSARERRPRVRARQDSADASAVIVDGEIEAGDSSRVSLTFRDQPRAFLEALRTALGERGITVQGGVSTARPSPPAGLPPEPPGILLFSLTSPPLSEVLAAFEKPSQNQIGEILLKTLGRARAGAGTADSGARVVRDQLIAWGAPADGFVVRDGSGLSRYNVVSPETIVKVLDAMRQSPHYRIFHAVLPIAGVDGTIRNRMRDTPAQNNLHAKTGTLNMVRSLSGYVTAADGRQLIVSMLANHFTVPTREIDALHEGIAVRLAGLGGGSR